MTEQESQKAVILYEYSKYTKGKWNPKNYTDWLLDKYLELRFTESPQEQNHQEPPPSTH